MKNLFFALAILLSPIARAETVQIDVSGSGGRDGYRGGSGSNGSSSWSGGSNGSNGSDGESGRDGEHGTSGGMIDVEVGFVPGTNGKKIYVRGSAQRAGGASDRIDRVYDTDSVTGLQFLANGGRGGSGGEGGDGGRGGDGANGSSGSYTWSGNGGNGGNGGDGGRGGTGGRGGDGGSSGRVRVRLAAGSELLGPLVHIQADPGRAGDGGRGGSGGSSGSGGWGGSAGCETRNGKEECGWSGSSGSSGRTGSSGNSGSEGRNGDRYPSEFADTNGRTIDGVYDIQTVRFNYDEGRPDGVVEHGEKLTIKSVTLRNGGRGDAPPAKYTLNLPNGEQRVVNLPALPYGKEVTIPIDPAIVVEARDGQRGFPYSLRMDYVNIPVQAPSQFVVQQPVQLTDVELPKLTTLEKQQDLVIQLRNVSQKDYGKDGEVTRKVKVRLEPVPGVSPPFVQLNGELVPLDRAREIEVPVVKAGEALVLKVPVRAPDNWKPGHAAQIKATLVVDDAKVTQRGSAKADFITDPDGAIKRSFDVAGAGVFCRFSWQLMKNDITGVIVDKSPKDDTVVVTIHLDGKAKDSPHFQVKMSELPRDFRDRLLRQQPIDSYTWIDMLKSLTPPSSSMWSSWKIKSCVVKQDKVKPSPKELEGDDTIDPTIPPLSNAADARVSSDRKVKRDPSPATEVAPDRRGEPANSQDAK